MQTPTVTTKGGWTGLTMPVGRDVEFIGKLLETCPDCIYVYDLEKRRAVYRNRTLHAMLGFADQEIECPEALIPRQLVHLEDRVNVEELLASLVDLPPSAVRVVTLRLCDRRRQWRYVRIRLTPLERRSGKGTTRVLGLITDISEQKWAEARADAARAAAEQASAAKSRFIAQVSHELRTPLNAVAGAVSLLAMTEMSLAQQEYAGIVLKATDAMTDLVNEVLDLGKVEAGKVQLRHGPFGLTGLVDSVLSALGPRAAAKGLILLQSLATDLPATIVGDEVRLRQILYNLVANAVKFTESGQVELRLSLRGESTQRLLVLEVADTGVGIPLDEQARLFKKYEQGAAALRLGFVGTGLGLAICQGLARAMGGRITCRSAPGTGSTFQVEIPVALADPGYQRVFPPNLLAGKRIRIFSDNDASAGALRRLLEGLGAQIDGKLIDADGEPVYGDGLARLTMARDVDAVIFDRRTGGPGMRKCTARMLARPDAPALRILLEPVGPELDQAAALAREAAALCMAQPASLSRLCECIAAGAPVQGPKERAGAVAKPLGLSVLVVDDNETNRLVLARLLEACTCRVHLACDGVEALAIAKAQRFDVILMDCQMPIMDGLTATRAIRQGGACSGARIYALSAHVSAEDRSACLGAGMDDVLTKPIRLAELQERLAKKGESP